MAFFKNPYLILYGACDKIKTDYFVTDAAFFAESAMQLKAGFAGGA